MLRPRIIVCLLVRDKAVVKTVRFGDAAYIGDPLNAVRIFNEKEVDELMVLDIGATPSGNGPDYSMIRNVAAECRMPLCYGGGVRSAEQARRVFELGVEKVALGAAAVEDPELVSRIAVQSGRQSVVALLDVKKDGGGTDYEVWPHNARPSAPAGAAHLARQLEEAGAGEIVLNAIDRDGTMQGYDAEMAAAVRGAITVPMTVLGGAGSLKDIGDLIVRFGLVGAAAGSLFVFKGRYKAVLFTYPDAMQKEALFREHYRCP